jgi:hypothetical protein
MREQGCEPVRDRKSKRPFGRFRYDGSGGSAGQGWSGGPHEGTWERVPRPDRGEGRGEHFRERVPDAARPSGAAGLIELAVGLVIGRLEAGVWSKSSAGS